MLYNGYQNNCCNDCERTESPYGNEQCSCMGQHGMPSMGLGCGCQNVMPRMSAGCGCQNSCMESECGCGKATPIYMPEKVQCCHQVVCHEQPIIVPVENRTIVHHGHTPRYYQTARYTTQHVVEEDTFAQNDGMSINPYMGNRTNGMY